MEDQVNLFGIIGLKQVSIEVLQARVKELEDERNTLEGERNALASRLEDALEEVAALRALDAEAPVAVPVRERKKRS